MVWQWRRQDSARRSARHTDNARRQVAAAEARTQPITVLDVAPPRRRRRDGCQRAAPRQARYDAAAAPRARVCARCRAAKKGVPALMIFAVAVDSIRVVRSSV